MASLNKVMLIGRIGIDPVTRYAANGSAVSNVSLGTSSSWKDKATGEKKEETEWHRVVFYGKIAEVVEQYVKKGSQIYVEGRLKTKEWVDKEGVKKFTTEIIADQIQLFGKRDDNERQQSQKAKPKQANPESMNDDDIPF